MTVQNSPNDCEEFAEQAALGFHECVGQNKIDLDTGTGCLVSGHCQHVPHRLMILDPQYLHKALPCVPNAWSAKRSVLPQWRHCDTHAFQLGKAKLAEVFTDPPIWLPHHSIAYGQVCMVGSTATADME